MCAIRRFRSLLLLLFTCLPPPGRSSSAGQLTGGWPVFFEHLGQVHSRHNRFDLSLQVDTDLPGLDARLTKIQHKLLLLDTEFRDPEGDDGDVPKRRRRKKKSQTRLDELNSSWREQNENLRERCENQRRRVKDLKELGKHRLYSYHDDGDEDEANRVLSRKKRQGFLKGMFGVAYHQDVEGVKRSLSGIENKLSSGVNEVRAKTDQLRTRTRDMMQRQNSEINLVEDMAVKLERKVISMETNPFMKTSISDLVHMRNEAYKKLSLQVDMTEERLVEIETTVTALGSGKLSKSVISPAKLRETLRLIQDQLPENYTLLFGADEALWPYYSVPLVDLPSTLKLDKVHNLPLKVKDGYSVIADLTTEYLVTDRTKNYFLELYKEDFQDCRVYKKADESHMYCGLGPLLRADRSRSCVMDLFNGWQDSPWCQSRLRHGMVQPFVRLNNGSWVFSAVTEEVDVVLECPPGERNPTQLYGFGVLSLPEGCTISSEDFWYAHTFAGVIQINIGMAGNIGDDDDNRRQDDGEDSFENYDMSKFEGDVLYQDVDSGADNDGDGDALIQEYFGEKEEDGAATQVTSPDPTELVPTEGSAESAQLEVSNPLNKEATEIYKDLLVKIKDTFVRNKWIVVK